MRHSLPVLLLSSLLLTTVAAAAQSSDSSAISNSFISTSGISTSGISTSDNVSRNTVAASTPAASPARHWGAELQFLPGRAIVMDHYQRSWQRRKTNFALGAELHYSPLPTDSDAFAYDYYYPTLSVGLRYHWNHGVTMHRCAADWGSLEVPYDSHLGNIVTLYGAFTRPFVRSRHWAADYTLAIGASYSHRKYNPRDNVDDELIGSHFLIYFGAGLHVTWALSPQWGLRAGIDYYHHSNGALNRPNKGANFLAPSIAAVYQPYYRQTVRRHAWVPTERFRPYWYVNLTAGIGAKTLDEDWQRTQFHTAEGSPDYRTDHFRLHAAYAFSADVMRRYQRRWASGLGLDLFYATYSDHIERMDRAEGYTCQHSPWSLGLAAKHEVFWHQFSLAMSLGVYLYRHMGHDAGNMEKPYYERIGLHYTFRHLGGLQLGANVKAHRTKADLTEVTISWPIKWQ